MVGSTWWKTPLPEGKPARETSRGGGKVAKEQYQQSVSELDRSEMRHAEPEDSLLNQAEKKPA